MIIKNFAQISNSSFVRIQELIVFSLNHFFTQIKSHQEFKIEGFLEGIIEGIGPVFTMLGPSYAKKLWKFVYENFTTLYIQMIVIMSQKYKSKETKLMLDKMKVEIEIFQDFFEEQISKKDFTAGKEKIENLIKTLTGNEEEIIHHIFELRMKLRDKFNEKCMKCLMRLRKDFNKKKRAKVIQMLEEEEEKMKNASKRNIGKMFYKGIMAEFRIHQFVQKFRLKLQLKKENLRKKVQQEKDRAVKTINENERMEVEEAAISLRGNLRWCKKTIAHNQNEEAIIGYADNYHYATSHFYFDHDLLLWKEKNTSTQILGRINLAALKDVGVASMDTFYFVR